jgi:hypothetical protein
MESKRAASLQGFRQNLALRESYGRVKFSAVPTNGDASASGPSWLRGGMYLQVLRMATATGQGQARIGLARQKFAGLGTFSVSRLFIRRALG